MGSRLMGSGLSSERPAAPTAAIQRSLSSIAARARVRGEVSLATVRAAVMAAGVLYESVFLALHPDIAARPMGWVALFVLAVGLAVGLLGLREMRAGRGSRAALSVSVGLDALLAFGVSIGAVLDPPADYRGLFFHPTMPFFVLGICSSALRMSRPLVRVSVACNVGSSVLLLVLDRVVGRTPAPGFEPWMLWTVAFFTAAFIADAGALRARRLVRDAAEAAIAAERTRQTLGLYVSEEVAEAALAEGRPMPGGHRQAVAVMFCDLRGFTAYAAAVPAERLIGELNAWLAVMVQVIREEGGVIDKYIGDSIMAVFGVPNSLPDLASRALRAAIAMQRALDVHNADRAARGLVPLQQTIGVHFGEVVVGNVGSPERMQYTVLGDAVNVASRPQGMAADVGATILASSAVVEVAGRQPGMQPPRRQGVLAIRGRPEGIDAFAIDAEAA
jgi:class 3 adenylate cyclase